MKKGFLIITVLVLLSLTAVPVMAAGSHNGHGNGNKNGQADNKGDQLQVHSQSNTQARGRSHNKSDIAGVTGNNHQQSGRQRTPFYLQGTITALDTTAKTITVSVFHGNARVKLYIGTDLLLNTSTTTKIFKLTQQEEVEGTAATTSTENLPDNNEAPANRVAITFEQLAVGDKVAIHGNVVAGTINAAVMTFNATLITVYVELPAQPLKTPETPVPSLVAQP